MGPKSKSKEKIKNIFLFLLFLFLCVPSAFATPPTPICYFISQYVCANVTPTNPLPAGVYGGSLATAGYVLTSNGPGALATFQPGGGGGGGLTVGTTTISGGTNGRIEFNNAGILGEYNFTGTGVVAMSTQPVFATSITLGAANIITDTTTGTKIGTATNQKLGFFNSTPVVQQSGNVCTAMQNLGLVASCTESGSGGVSSLTGDSYFFNNSASTGAVTLTRANHTANSLVGALTATTNSDLSVPSCSTASSALTWTSGTGFGCNTISGSGTVTSSGSPVSGNVAAFSTSTNIVPATSTNIISLFSGCTGTQYLGADGACHTASGGGTPGGSSGQIQTNNGSGGFGVISSLVTSFCSTAFTTADCASFFGYYDPRWYGAKIDGLTLTDITTTATNATITSAAHTFTSGDVGKYISVNAGTSSTITGNTINGTPYITNSGLTGAFPGNLITGTGIPANTTILQSNGNSSFTISNNATATGTGVTFTVIQNYSATISSISGNTATLSAAAGTSITSTAIAIFGTDDSTAIESSVTAAAAAGGGLIKLPVGNSIIANTVNWANKVSITGVGPQASAITWISTSDLINGMIAGFSGTCTVAAAQAYQDNHFSNFEMNGAYATAASHHVQAKALTMPCVVRAMIDHMYIHDLPATCIGNDVSLPVTVTNNVIGNCGRLDLNGNGSNGIGEGTFAGLPGEGYIIANNYIYNVHNRAILIEGQTGTTSSAYVDIVGNVVQNIGYSLLGVGGGIAVAEIGGVISGNRIATPPIPSPNGGGSASCGICLDSSTTNQVSPVETVISGNSVDGGKYGISLNYNTPQGPTTIPVNVIITGNRIKNAGANGIFLSSNSTTVGDGVSITNNEITFNGLAGILVTGTAGWKNLVINGNNIANNGLTGSTIAQAGIEINSPITNFTMIGNYLYDDSTSTQKYGLSVATGITGTGAYITNNNFTGNVTSAIDMVGSLTGVVNNNVGMPAPTITGCSNSTVLGNGDIGSVVSGTTGACALVITPFATANIIAVHGYVCNANDLTTPSDLINQSASTTTTATISGTTVASDVINFSCRMW